MVDRYRCGPDSNWQDEEWPDQMAQSQRVTQITMQANSVEGDMPQYDNSWGSATRSKDNEACERPDDPRKGGMPQYATHRGQQLDQKVNESRGKSDDLGEGVCPSMTVNILRYTMSQNYCTLKYVHPSCNENVRPQIGNAKQDHVSWHHADKTKLTGE